MSMTVRVEGGYQKADSHYSFDLDKANNDLVSLTAMGYDPASQYKKYAPAPVRLQSTSNMSKAGVATCRIVAKVPIRVTGSDVTAPAGSRLRNFDNKFAQVALTVSLPSREGVLAKNRGAVAPSGEQIGAAEANKYAVLQGLALVLNLVCNQEMKGEAPLMNGVDVLDWGTDLTFGTLDSSNPITRGLSGVVPIDPNVNRSIKADDRP